MPDIITDPVIFTVSPESPGLNIITVNDEVFGPSTLTFQSIVTVASLPALFTVHPVSEFDFTPGDAVSEFAGNSWINIGIGIGSI